MLAEFVKKKRKTTEKKARKLNESESRLAAIWKDVLKIEEVDVERSFFELGGDSLSLVFLLSDIEKEFGVELAMNQFARANSIKQVAELIDSGSSKYSVPIDLTQEIEKQELTFLNHWKPHRKQMKTQKAILTGATGFVGIFS